MHANKPDGMVTTLVSPVGTRKEPVLEFTKQTGFNRLVLLPGKSAKKVFGKEAKEGVPEPKKVAQEIKSNLSQSYGKIDIDIRSINPFEFQECLEKVIEVLAEERKKSERVVVCIAPGTSVVAASIGIGAIITGCEISYVQEKYEDGELFSEVTEPLRYNFEELEEVTQEQRRTLLAIEDGMTARDLEKKVGKNYRTISQYLIRLKKYGLIEEIKDEGRSKRYQLTNLGRICKIMWRYQI